MATKKNPVVDLVSQSMAERDILYETPAVPPEAASGRGVGSGSGAGRRKKRTTSINFDEGDYAALQRIDEEQGLTASALIRQAVKQILKAAQAQN
jgi:hypothetical protein